MGCTGTEHSARGLEYRGLRAKPRGFSYCACNCVFTYLVAQKTSKRREAIMRATFFTTIAIVCIPDEGKLASCLVAELRTEMPRTH